MCILNIVIRIIGLLLTHKKLYLLNINNVIIKFVELLKNKYIYYNTLCLILTLNQDNFMLIQIKSTPTTFKNKRSLYFH